jgi:hypothetical protein
MVVNTRTRFGRVVKKPTLYVPVETVLDDDYATDEHDDTDSESLIDTEDEYKSDDESDDDDDADENGNLKDFVVDDDEASESESEEE